MPYPPPTPMISVDHDAKTDFSYDNSGNLLSFKCRRGGLQGKVVGTMTMTYDNQNRITSQVFEEGSGS